MLLSDAFCYVLLTITVTATGIQGDTFNRKSSEKHKRINKRDAAIYIDTMPIEPLYDVEPKIIYRRVSSQKYVRPKSKYSLPRGKPRLKGMHSSKKYKKHVSPQYSHPRYNKRHTKPKPNTYRPHKWAETKPIYGVPKKVTYTHYAAEPTGFGEPPPEYTSEYQRPRPSYSEQPIDSYGAPVPTSIVDAYPTSQGYSETKFSSHIEDTDRDHYRSEYNSWQTAQQEEDFDNSYAFTKKRPSYSKPAMRPFERPEQDEDENVPVNSYPDLYRYKKDPYYLHRNKKPQYFPDSRLMNKPWKSPKLKPTEDELIVGGQYAEPPARYAKFQPSAPMQDNDEEFAPVQGFVDSDVPSATISPYVNYKNSNMAFSPQNLNDAFSIVEK